ncbi:MAG: DNA mismatch repair endonuclease MutL, partial [Turicibacter sp.]
MGKILRMNEQLANMIAAGEVIERPASVVKELLENAVDAGSTQIEIHLIDSGIRQIKVIDNGEGMEASDAVLAFERHATSKVKTQYDIFRIQTLGFRGEALPSIASISDVHVRTSAGLETGTHIHIKGGDLLANEPGLMRKGTEMEVNHLFFNTPARLKHIKSLNTELSHITDYLNKVALSHPEIAFKLFNNQRLLFQSNGQNNLQSVIA